MKTLHEQAREMGYIGFWAYLKAAVIWVLLTRYLRWVKYTDDRFEFEDNIPFVPNGGDFMTSTEIPASKVEVSSMSKS